MRVLDRREALGRRRTAARGRRRRRPCATGSSASVLGREGRRVGQAAGERDDLGALGDRHQVAHRRGLHDLRARREEAGVALELAALASCGRTVRRRAAELLSSISHARRTLPDLVTTPPRHSPGHRRGRRRRHPPVPARPRGRRARDRRRRASTSTARRSRSSSRRGSCWPSPSRSWSSSCCCARGSSPTGGRGGARGHRHRPRRAALRRARSPTATHVWWPGLVGGVLCARCSRQAARAVADRAHPRAPRRRGAPRRCRLRRGRGARARAASAILVPAGLACSRSASSSGCCVGGAPARGREVRRPAHPAVSAPRKLVLAVIDGMKPAMLERAIAHRAARPALAAIDRARDATSTTASPRSRRSRRSAPATIATGAPPGPPPDPVDELVLARRGALRRVRLVVRAARRFGIARQLTDTIYNMNAAHLPADVPTIFESLDDAGVRTAGTTYLIYRGRHEHEVSRATALTRLAVDASSAARSWARASSSTPTSSPAARPAAARSSGCPGVRDQHAGCVGAYLVEHDLFDFLLLSLPDNDTHSHKHGPHAQVDVDRRRPTASSSALVRRRRRRRRVPRRARDDRRGRPLPRAVERGDRPRRRRSPSWQRAAGRRAPRAERRRDRAVPGAARGDDLRARARGARRARPARSSRRRAGDRRRRPRRCGATATREGAIAGERGELRFAPGGDVARPARPALARRRRPRGPRRARRGRRAAQPTTTPTRSRRVWAALTCATSGDVLLSRRARLRVPRLGRRRPRRRRQPRLAAPRRLARRAAVLRRRVRRERPTRHWSITDVAPMVLAHFGVPA